MKKILFLITTLGTGGAERVLIDLVNNLDCELYDITVQTVLDEGAYKDQLRPNIKYKTILKEKRKIIRSIKIRIVYYLLNSKSVYRKFIKDEYDIEVAFLEGIPTKIISGFNKNNCRKIAWVHTDLLLNYSSENVYNNNESIIKAYNNFDDIVCVSDSVKDSFLKKYGEFDNARVINNVIDPEKIISKSVIKSSNSKKIDEFTIISVGRLVKEKGYDRLLEIHRRLINEGIKHKLLIVGDGIERTKLQSYIDTHSLQKSAELVGFQENPYVYMSEANLYVSSSRVEGYSTVVAEALVLGLPVVTTNCSGMMDLLGDSEYGIITENNLESLYSQIKIMITDKQKYNHFKAKAIEKSREFSMNDKIQEYINFFN